jgi:arsenate reductase (glutaredoxin)
LLEEKGIAYRYRDYVRDPLSEKEIRQALRLLGLEARDVLRTKDAAFQELGLTGDEPEGRLIELMARHPTLLQRPIGIANGRAVVGRPPEALLKLAT